MGLIFKTVYRSTLLFHHLSSRLIRGWKKNETGLHELYNTTQVWVMEDRLQYIKDTLNMPGAQTNSQPYYLLERHPMLCGVFAFSLVLDFQELGIVLANAWGL